MLVRQFKFNFACDNNGGSSSYTIRDNIIRPQENINRYKFIEEEMKNNVEILFSGFGINECKESDNILGPFFKVYCKLFKDCVTIESICKTCIMQNPEVNSGNRSNCVDERSVS